MAVDSEPLDNDFQAHRRGYALFLLLYVMDPVVLPGRFLVCLVDVYLELLINQLVVLQIDILGSCRGCMPMMLLMVLLDHMVRLHLALHHGNR